MRNALDQLREGADELLTGDLSSLSGADVVMLARELEAVRRQLCAVDHRVVAEVESRRLAGEYARSSTAELLVTELRLAPAQARSRVAQAEVVGPRHSLTGEPLPALLPLCAAAVAAGAIGGAHIEVIAHCLDALPPSLPIEAFEVAEAVLVEAARHEHPAALRRSAAMLLARLDPDGVEPREDQLHRRRDVTLTRNSDGSGRLVGRLTVEATLALDTILDTLSAPVPADGGGERDVRSAGQRRHDGLLEASQRLLRSGSLPPAGGVPVTILVRTTSDAVDSGTGVALTSRGDLISIRELASMSSDAEIQPVHCTPEGAVLALGRSRRLATRAQRLALAARDGGCTFPGCERPSAWTEVHHVTAWQDGGSTDIDNLCLLCRYHHREFESRGWQVRISQGVPEWTPPAWLDPARTPRRNTAHHPPDIDFTRVSPAAA